MFKLIPALSRRKKPVWTRNVLHEEYAQRVGEKQVNWFDFRLVEILTCYVLFVTICAPIMSNFPFSYFA